MSLPGLESLPATRRIFCIGRNYAEHAREMGGGTAASEPVVFMKPATSLVFQGQPLRLPHDRGSVHHEMELVLAIGREAEAVEPAAAPALLAGAALGLDLTLRDEQARLKQAGSPWELAKAFDGSAAVGRFSAAPFSFDPQALDMLFPITAILAFLSRRWRLLPGDLVYTGTPAGVGPLRPADRIELSSPALGSYVWDCK